MANEASITPPLPIELTAPLSAGATEDCRLSINDVVLRIPPQNIQVVKQSLNYEWGTLRTPYLQKVKSGYGNVVINLDLVFSGYNDLNYKLKPLVAGLRATPFCACYSKYLDSMLRGLEVDVGAGESERYFMFRPMVLALRQMTIHTMPGQPDSIGMELEFLWFNYYPFLSNWVYKIGEGLDASGTVFNSVLWKKFYQPFLGDKNLKWPHATGSESHNTAIYFREFNITGFTSEAALQAVRDLLNIIKHKPDRAISTLSNLVSSRDVRWTGQNIWDIYYKKIGREALSKGLEVNEEVRKRFEQSSLPDGAITTAVESIGAGNLLRKIVRGVANINPGGHSGNANSLSSDEQKQIDSAILQLKKQEQNILATKAGFNRATLSDNSSGYIKIDSLSQQRTYSSGGQSTQANTEIWGRKRKLMLGPEYDSIIEHISITLSYNLATIPMTAYRYATLQFTGGSDLKVQMSLNCGNNAAASINAAYDAVDNTSLKFRMVPQGYRNIWIRNDLLNFLGFNEFLTESIVTNTAPGMPGRSIVVLGLTHSGMLSTTRIAAPETLNQELVYNDEQVILKIIQILLQNAVIRGERERGIELTEARYWHLIPTNSPNTPKTKAMGKFTQEFCNNYNYLLDTMFQRIMVADLSPMDEGWEDQFRVPLSSKEKTTAELWSKESLGSDAVLNAQNFAYLMTLREQDAEYGALPGIEAIKTAVIQRDAAIMKQQCTSRTMQSGSVDTRSKLLDRIRYSQKLQRNFGIQDPEIKALIQALKTYSNERDLAFGVPIREYQSGIRSLADKIYASYMDLSEFQPIRKIVAQLGLHKGAAAYTDFHPQLESVAGFLSQFDREVVSNTQYLNPDVYLFNPMLDGGALNVDSGSIIDANVISQARALSLESFRNAQGAVGDWFRDYYYQDLLDSEQQLTNPDLRTHHPANKLRDAYNQTMKDLGYSEGGSIPYSSNIYAESKWDNSLLAQSKLGAPMSKNFPIDFQAKAYSNTSGKIAMMSANHNAHFSFFPDLWDEQEVGGPASDYTSGLAGDYASEKWYQDMERMVKFLLDYEAAAKQHSLTWGGWFHGPQTKANAHTNMRLQQWLEASHGKINGWDPEHVQYYGVLPKGYSQEAPNGKFVPAFETKLNKVLAELQHKGWKPRVFSGVRSQDVSEYSSKSQHPLGLAADLMEQTIGAPMAVLDRYFAGKQKAKKEAGKTRAQAIQRQTVGTSVTATATQPLQLAIKEFEKELYTGQAQTLNRAYPCFKLYFIEDDQSEHRLGFDDFFSYSAVQSIRVVRDRNIAADLCELYITNISGILTNQKFRQERDGGIDARSASGQVIQENPGPMSADTKKENPIASLMLQQGTHISLYLGYSNDSAQLELVFTGVITEIEMTGSEDLIRILAQSYAIELVQDLKGVSEPIVQGSHGWGTFNFFGFFQGASTGRILEEMITQPEVLHFGRWDPLRPISTSNRDLLTNKWDFKPTPQDDNIYPPSTSEQLSNFADDYIFTNIRYVIYRTTIWDIFQEMTLRHPNFVAAAVPYKGIDTDRMTMFFGLPNQLYFARDPNWDENIKSNKLKRIQADLQQKLKNNTWEERFDRPGTGSSYWGVASAERMSVRDLDNAQKRKLLLQNIQSLTNQRLEYAKTAGFIKPFRAYHLLTSNFHIVHNGIQANARDVANTIVVRYNKGSKMGDNLFKAASLTWQDIKSGNSDRDDIAQSLADADEEFTVALDAALPTEEVRATEAAFLNVTNENLAKRYGLGMLLRHTRDIYRGELVILGNPSVKPIDYCYLLDEQNDMLGVVEVDRVTHVFTQDQGFLTEIKPSMLAQAGEWSLLHSADALGLVMEGWAKDMASRGGVSGLVGKVFGFMAPTFTPYVEMFGGFVADRIVNYTQLGYPLVLTPLTHHGRVFAGGVPTSKLPKSAWKCIFGEWTPLAKEGFEMWLEDKTASLMGGIKQLTLGYSEGQFWNNDNTLEVQ